MSVVRTERSCLRKNVVSRRSGTIVGMGRQGHTGMISESLVDRGRRDRWRSRISPCVVPVREGTGFSTFGRTSARTKFVFSFWTRSISTYGSELLICSYCALKILRTLRFFKTFDGVRNNVDPSTLSDVFAHAHSYGIDTFCVRVITRANLPFLLFNTFERCFYYYYLFVRAGVQKYRTWHNAARLIKPPITHTSVYEIGRLIRSERWTCLIDLLTITVTTRCVVIVLPVTAICQWPRHKLCARARNTRYC